MSIKVVATFVPKKPSSVHSFSITENYAVFFFYPVVIDGAKMFEAGFHVFELLTWLEDEPTDVFVVNLKTGEVTTMETKPTYSAHHANAYEEQFRKIYVQKVPKLSIYILIFLIGL